MPRATSDLTRLTQGGTPGRKPRSGHLGRTTKLTPEVSKKICDAIRAGNYETVAARYAGVSPYTLLAWKRKGAESSSPNNIYRQFLQSLDEAEAVAEVSANLHWRAAMPKDWHSAERWLQVRYPERYSSNRETLTQQTAVQVNVGALGGPTQETQALPSHTIARLLEDNPEMIAGTMSVLDQLLPTTSPETSEGDWREVPQIVEDTRDQLQLRSDEEE